MAVMIRVLSSDAEPAFSPKAPVDAASAARDPGDVLAKARFDLAGPGDELETAAAVGADAFDHRVAARGQAQLAAVGAGDMFAGRRGSMRQAGLGLEAPRPLYQARAAEGWRGDCAAG